MSTENTSSSARNAKRLREIVWEELVAAGELEQTSERDRYEAREEEARQSRVKRHKTTTAVGTPPAEAGLPKTEDDTT